MSLRLQVCGKLLRCAHKCLEKAGKEHICICSRKWTYDPGCQHWVSGMCSDFTNLSLVCMKICEKPLICGHLCSVACSSNDCFCDVCFDKHSMTGPMTVIDKKSVDFERASPAPFVVDAGSSKLAATAGTSAGALPDSSKMDSEVGLSAGPLPGSSKMASAAGPSSGPFPGSSKMGFTGMVGHSSKVREDSLIIDEAEFIDMVSSIFTDAFESQGLPIPQPATDLPQDELDQVKKLMLDSALNKDDPSTWELIRNFNRCANGHIFFAERDSCHVCGCPGQGPTFGMINVHANLPDLQDIIPGFLDPVLSDENAWKFGMTKCHDGHFFKAALSFCDTCGRTAAHTCLRAANSGDDYPFLFSDSD